MSARPTRYCETCGEYVADQPVTRLDGYRRPVTQVRLVHISADGVRIDRAHKPTEAAR